MMAIEQPSAATDDGYLLRLQSLLITDHPGIHWSLETKGTGMTRVHYTDMLIDFPIVSPSDLISQSKELANNRSLSVCIIENISPQYVEALGSAWEIDPMFFVEYATNPDQKKLWWSKKWEWNSSARPSPGQDERRAETMAPSFLQGTFGHLDGVFEYHNMSADLHPSEYDKLNSSPNRVRRHCFKTGRWPVQSNTRISYCRPNAYMYLFLVDAPLNFLAGILNPRSRSCPTLKFPNGTNRGGIELPRLLPASENQYSVFENLRRFCQHPWHLRLLFNMSSGVFMDGLGNMPIEGVSTHTVVPQTSIPSLSRSYKTSRLFCVPPMLDPPSTHEAFAGFPDHHPIENGEDILNVLPSRPFTYILASCLLEENLRYLEREIRCISFTEIRNPRLKINTELHDRREDLAQLKDGLVKTAMYTPTSVKAYFDAQTQRELREVRMQLDRNFTRLIMEATKLEGFLMETFQLFMSSLSVQDSRLSIAQAQRGSRLTILAFIYVPLSFVTGIFGMNIRQINESGLEIWVCFVALAAVVFLTVPVFLAVKLYEDRKVTKGDLVQKSVV